MPQTDSNTFEQVQLPCLSADGQDAGDDSARKRKRKPNAELKEVLRATVSDLILYSTYVTNDPNEFVFVIRIKNCPEICLSTPSDPINDFCSLADK